MTDTLKGIYSPLATPFIEDELALDKLLETSESTNAENFQDMFYLVRTEKVLI